MRAFHFLCIGERDRVLCAFIEIVSCSGSTSCIRKVRKLRLKVALISLSPCFVRCARLPVPGTSEGRPFSFGTPYKKILEDLGSNPDHRDFYTKTKIFSILERNHLVKVAPQRWQDLDTEAVEKIDVVICFEQRIFNLVLEGEDWNFRMKSACKYTCLRDLCTGIIVHIFSVPILVSLMRTAYNSITNTSLVKI